jgi:hypothetical protein
VSAQQKTSPRTAPGKASDEVVSAGIVSIGTNIGMIRASQKLELVNFDIQIVGLQIVLE